jgi:hypothetical protein
LKYGNAAHIIEISSKLIFLEVKIMAKNANYKEKKKYLFQALSKITTNKEWLDANLKKTNSTKRKTQL